MESRSSGHQPPVGLALDAPARDRGVEAEVGVDGLDRPVRAEGDGDAVRHERVPTVGAEHAVLAKSVLRPALVRDGVRGLHRGDDAAGRGSARSPEARRPARARRGSGPTLTGSGGTPRASRPRRPSGCGCPRGRRGRSSASPLCTRPRRPSSAMRLARSPMQWSVIWKPARVALEDHRVQLLGRHARDAAVVRVVGEGREHGRGARAQRAVHVALDAPTAAATRVRSLKRRELGALALQLLDRVVEVLPLGDADGEPTLPPQLAVELASPRSPELSWIEVMP